MSTANKMAPQADVSDKEIIFRESFVFVLELINFTELLRGKGKYFFAKQILKSGVSFGKIINEMRLVSDNEKNRKRAKELIKTAIYLKYLLQLCKYSENYPDPNSLIADLEQIRMKVLII